MAKYASRPDAVFTGREVLRDINTAFDSPHVFSPDPKQLDLFALRLLK